DRLDRGVAYQPLPYSAAVLRALRRALPWRLVRAPTRDGRGEEQA
ncbi:hypothetical protein, partial [Pseudomonas aeruginosa]